MSDIGLSPSVLSNRVSYPSFPNTKKDSVVVKSKYKGGSY